MNKFRPIAIILFFLVSVIAIRFLVPKEKSQEQANYALAVKAAEKLSLIWNTGHHLASNELLCPDLFKKWPLASDKLKCNPLFLKCLFRTQKIVIKDDKKSLKVSVAIPGDPYRIRSKSIENKKGLPDWGLEVEIKINNLVYPIWLEDSCSQVFLPKRIYQYESGKEKFFWDNFSSDWFIDKRPVLNRELQEWRRVSGRDKPGTLNLENHYGPAINQSLSDMKSYCRDRGKKLMRADLFDAASFHPGNIKSNRPKLIFNNPYPWTRRKRGTFPDLFKQGKLKKLKRSHCLKIPSLECLNLLEKEDLWFKSSPSWVGSFQSLGGVMEYMDNPANSLENISLSSWHLSLKSEWNQLGVRSFWDTEGFSFKNFKWKNDRPEHKVQKLEVGFRCLKLL